MTSPWRRVPRGLPVVIAVVMAASVTGCGRRPALEAPPFDPAAAVAAAMSAADADGSGGLSLAEYDAFPGLVAAAPRIDADGDGTLARAELTARFAVYKAAAGVVVPVKYRVVLDGRPLPGATVALAPESFMGPSRTACSGTTGGDGDVVVSADDVRAKGFAGVYPGLYRITVVPAGGDAAKGPLYDADGAAEIGQEVAPDMLRELEQPRLLSMTSRRPKAAAR